ncbi:circularly permuted type 2 ATP-grasp protein [Flavobacterium cellulosilyticum]|uniref:Circularly permuted type 2 ATP-grasp protein n=1 Tax=Flavobacterium cellulosilyticum TaxID=2541731 RepID=A0A4R5CPN8_9FLAO|nr:circularly permuted type 2 ATP-grasp protein [Flavobacterium cellulosilyticum]TDD99542.1 circularly permuted type 2 ATP-grasp protein [Flavobacterium cellulosilyticum]
MMKLPPKLNPNGWDEMFSNKGVRNSYRKVLQSLQGLTPENLSQKQRQASDFFMNQGITFTVYSDDNQGIERIFPFDIIPRIITQNDWKEVELGIAQRLKALNLFLEDIYNEQLIVKEGIIPAVLISTCPHYIHEVHGIKVPHDIHVHIAGIDLIRGAKGEFYVLEDNLRCPSGVSYMLENREITKRIFPEMFATNEVCMVANYPMLFHNILISLSPRNISNPNVVLLTPGIYNSAYYEHTFLARQMGIPLVEGRDLVVNNSKVYMKTTSGLQQVDVIYRRLDDEYLDPLVFKPDSVLGVPGLISAYKTGNVALVNAVGNGVADDKAVYAYVPDMIKYYLNEEPILKNVPTYQMSNKEEREFVFANMGNMVIKETNGSGGYGMVMGNKATEKELEDAKIAILNDPRNFIAQPIIQLSTVPCLIDGELKLRHVDLRPYALCGPNGVKLVPGGLTRVALTEGSLVVNSSQGGGSKDTWIVK